MTNTSILQSIDDFLLTNQVKLPEVHLYLYVFKHFHFVIPCFTHYLSFCSVFIGNHILLEWHLHISFNDPDVRTKYLKHA